MASILITMAEDAAATSASHFGIRYAVDEHDCLHFAQALKALGHEVYFANWMDLGAAEFARMFSFNASAFVQPVPVSGLDLVFVYKMEGFLRDLPRFHRMLERFSGCNVINDIATIRHNLDKSYLRELSAQGIHTIPGYSMPEALERLGEGQPLVVKPLKGERGNGVFLADNPSDLAPIRGREDQFFAQEFMPCVRNGERSLVFLGHEYQHAVIKHPRAGEFRCNESAGGSVRVYEPMPGDLEFAEGVLRAYETLGYSVHFSRVDFLESEEGPILLEVELLNPSVYANYSGKGKQFGERLADYFDRFLHARRIVTSVTSVTPVASAAW